MYPELFYENYLDVLKSLNGEILIFCFKHFLSLNEAYTWNHNNNCEFYITSVSYVLSVHDQRYCYAHQVQCCFIIVLTCFTIYILCVHKC